MFMAVAVLMASLAAEPPLALRGETESLGRGRVGTVVGVVFQVAPEDRERAGERVRVVVTLVREGTVLDRHSTVVDLSQDGSAMLFREWPVGPGQVRVVVESLDGRLQGAWHGLVTVAEEQAPFEAPVDAPADALALDPSPPLPIPFPGAVQFLTPPRAGGIGALQLEVSAPPEAAAVEFSRDGEILGRRNRPPWTVSVNLGEVARRTVVRATALDASGSVLGEDALVLNAPAGQIPVEILLGPEPAGGQQDRLVTVAVGESFQVEEVLLRAGEEVIGRWLKCPCVVRVPGTVLARSALLLAEARGPGGLRGEALSVLGGDVFVEQVRVEQVELPIVVTGPGGRPVTGLGREAFRVFEDGIEVPIQAFGTTADLPLSLGVAVDLSGSMRDVWDEVRIAVDQFASRLLRPGDRVFLTTFSWESKVVVDWTADGSVLGPVLDRMTPEGGTSLYDAIVASLLQFRGRTGRTALVLLSDGEDTTSRTGWDVALRFTQTARVPIFPVGFRIGRLALGIRSRLREVAESTGGELIFVPRSGDLSEAYARISEQLRAQYLISYRSPSNRPSGEFRAVRVEVAGEGLVARTIAGYYPSP